MQFFILHELSGESGRLRVRAASSLSAVLAATLFQKLEAVHGISAVQMNRRSASILFCYESIAARNEALSVLGNPHLCTTSRIVPIAKLAPRVVASVTGNSDECGIEIKGNEDDGGRGHHAPVGIGNVLARPVFRHFFVRPLLPFPMRMVSTLVRAVPYIWQGIKQLTQHRLSVEVLDASAILMAIAMKNYRTASMTMFLLGLGEILEAWTKRQSLARLSESLALNVQYAWRVVDGVEQRVPLQSIKADDIVVVRDGGAIPVDGTVAEGNALVNQSSMTGEPLGVARSVGASVYAGTVVEEGTLFISVKQVGEGTRLQQVLHFINESEALKAGIQGKTERMADIAVPFTFLLAGLVYLCTRDLMRTASVLMVDYSCALKLSTPLAILAAMREGAEHGVLVKGGRYLEALSEANTLVLDKTGTLTQAQPSVAKVVPANGYSRNEILRLAACLEEHFPHPVARAVVHQAASEKLLHEEEHTKVEYIVAHGIASQWRNKRVLIGSRHYVEQDEHVDMSPLQAEMRSLSDEGYSLLYLSIEGKLAGLIAIEDPVRPEAADVVRACQADGMRVIMLTGDDARTAKAVAARLGITEFRAQVLPADKAAVVKSLSAEGAKVAMLGDGINDSPALSAAHVGISLKDGADLAQEVANIVLLNSNLHSLLTARRLAKSTLQRINTNFTMTMVLNSLFLGGGLVGVLSPALASLLHNASTVGLAANAMRGLLPQELQEQGNIQA